MGEGRDGNKSNSGKPPKETWRKKLKRDANKGYCERGSFVSTGW